MSNEGMTFEELQNKLDEINTKYPDIPVEEITSIDEDENTGDNEL